MQKKDSKSVHGENKHMSVGREEVAFHTEAYMNGEILNVIRSFKSGKLFL